MEDGLTVDLDLRPLLAEAKLIEADLTDFTTPARWGFADWRVVVYQAWAVVKRTGGSFRGRQWRALAKDTRKDQADATINMDTGALLRSILKMDLKGNTVGQSTVVSGRVLLIGDALPEYGPYALEQGGRNVLFFAPGDYKIFARALTKWLDRRHGRDKR